MITKLVKITNPTGFGLNSVGELCKIAVNYKCAITFIYDKDNTANAKSVLSVLGAGIKAGDEIVLQCDGEDEEEALKDLVAFIESGIEV